MLAMMRRCVVVVAVVALATGASAQVIYKRGIGAIPSDTALTAGHCAIVTDTSTITAQACSATDLVCTDCVALGSETTGNYVATVADGTGIDGTAAAEGATYTPTLDLTEITCDAGIDCSGATTIIFDSTEVDAMTWGSSASPFTWVFSTGDTMSLAFADDLTVAGVRLTVNAPNAGEDNISIEPQQTTDMLERTGTITSADLTDNRTWTFGNESGTVCTTGSVCTGYQAGPLSGDVVTSGAAATIQANSVALGTDTTGNYAGSASEGGAATTALALDANGANCSAGQAPLGVDAAGAVEGCFAPTAAAAGSDGQLQYNNGGSVLGGADYRYDDTETQLESDADVEVQLDDNANGTNSWILYDGAGTALQTLTETGDSTLWDNAGGDLIFGGAANGLNSFLSNTADASDSECVCLWGGGAANDSTRGGGVCACGNQGVVGLAPGYVELDAGTGDASTSGVIIQIANVTMGYWEEDGDLEQAKHIAGNGTAPTASSCGTTPSVNSNATDIAGLVTTGTGSPTACTISFNKTWDSAPSCIVNYQGGTTATRVSSISTSAFTVTLAAGCSSCAINWICIGYQ